MKELDEFIKKMPDKGYSAPVNIFDNKEAELFELRSRLAECEDNLKSMVEQYCRGHFNSNDASENQYCHEFMSAGECTFEYLVKYGFAEYLENGVDIRLKHLEEK